MCAWISTLDRVFVFLRYQFISPDVENEFGIYVLQHRRVILLIETFSSRGWRSVTFLCRNFSIGTTTHAPSTSSNIAAGVGFFAQHRAYTFGYGEFVFDTQYTISIFTARLPFHLRLPPAPRHHHIVWKYVKMVSGLLPLCFLFITSLCKIAKFIFLLAGADWGERNGKWMISIKNRKVLAAKVDGANFLVRYD